jgi:hypothetical protein
MRELTMTFDRRRALAGIAAIGGTAGLMGGRLLAASGVPSRVVEPEDFAAIGDGRGDAAAAINAAIAELVQRGGGTLRLRSGKTYRLETTDPRTAATHPDYLSSIGLPPGAHDIVIDLNGAVLLQVADAHTIGSAFSFYNAPRLTPSVRPMRGTPQRGDSVVELAPGAQLPRVGSVVMLAAGNTTPEAFAPVAEMQIVSGISGRVVHFDRPLAKSYRPFAKAWFGAVPYGLFDLTDRSARNIALIGPGRIVNTRRRAGNLMQVLGLSVRGVSCEGRGGLALRGRDVEVIDCSARIQADWRKPIFRPVCCALDTGTSHATIRNFEASGGTGVTFLHLHEALADVEVSGLTIMNGNTYDPAAEGNGAISILGSSWNVTIDGATIVNNPQGWGIRAVKSSIGAGGNRNLKLRNITLAGDFRLAPVLIDDDAEVLLDNIDISRARIVPPRNAARKLEVKGARVKLGKVVDAPQG